ncbi:MAG: hypothetical protein A3F68_07890 [Acidobacteria bacterium RIFCSPLOWO2_12_FULL_54_10]|nr:MAG: hypothetical protein A3F68_07890 [Acidobacteria bacterium RIFCSPLOWO2_12_FULL_54_10]
MNQPPTSQNHYVPIWYQKGFIVGPRTSLYFLDLDPPKTVLPDGRVIAGRAVSPRAPKSCFWSEDLYTTKFGSTLNDEVERYLFGAIDNYGASAVRAFASNDLAMIHKLFQRFFEYLDAQKLRTPKGLDWIKSKYPNLTQLGLMLEMQGLRQMHCTMWYESVREIVSAKQSDVKFIVTDHPVTVYNAACPPASLTCQYPDDPSIEFKGTQTIFVLDADHCLILSNLEYAKNPTNVDLKASRTNARYYGQSIARTDAFVRSRKLSSEEVNSINHLLKARATRYIAASEKDWLYPERLPLGTWEAIGKTLLPPSDELWHFGGEIYIGYKDGTTHYQDEFGRTSGAHNYLRKKKRAGAIGRKDPCGCGSGRKFKNCCEGVPEENRSSWDVYSIRERNLMFINAVMNILGMNTGKTWDDVRRGLSDDQVKQIHEAFESLWPKDTNIVELLPRLDERVFRTLYLGVVDPRTITVNVTSWLVYFDEIYIPNPFVNAAGIKPEFSPTHSPGQYKSQTLKNVLLLMMLEPFIDAGLIHMIPDPTDFNDDFRRAAWGMAKERTANMKVDDKDMKRFRELFKDDFNRGTRGFPAESLRSLIRRSSPELSPEQIELVITHLKEEQANDPLALLQPIEPGEDRAQLQVIKGFNLELALFLAQFTGSVVYTDETLHWQHLHAHTGAANQPKALSVWSPLVERVQAVSFTLEANPQPGFQLRMTGKLDDIRRTFRRVSNFVRANGNRSVSKKAVKDLVGEFRRAKKNIRREWQALGSPGALSARLQGYVELSIPESGFERNTVRRLLLTYGRAKHVHAMPMAMFIKVETAS